MYVTYVKSQYCYQYGNLSCSVPNKNPTRQIPSPLPIPKDFMPTQLVRISDMKVVQGSEVNEGYCTLSYSWSWCGNNLVDNSTGKSTRNDQGKHKIVYPPRKIRQKPRGRKIIPGKIKFVKFEGIIQQICKDFNIKYIWYDQKCINQDDQEEKQREIRQMHQIYSNAYCTVALVPEFRTLFEHLYYSNKENQRTRQVYRIQNLYTLYCADWFTRAWTLEETVKSKRILFVGRDIHAWWYSIRRSPIISSLFQQPAEQNVCTILYYAHIRKCSKEHDRVFSLANIFPDAMDDIIIDYDQSLPELLICFYGILAKKDLSILCFGKWFTYGVFLGNEASRDTLLSLSNSFPEMLQTQTKDEKYVSPIQDYSLPSWTGVAGEHIPPLLGLRKESHPPTTTFQNYIVNGRFLELTCPYVISSINYINNSKDPDLYILRGKDLPPPPDEYDSFPSRYRHVNWRLAVRVSNGDNKNVVLTFPGLNYDPEAIDKFELWYPKSIFNENMNAISHFFNIRKKDLFWWNRHTCSKEPHAKMSFSLTMEYDPSLSCIILTGVPFDYGEPNWKRYPILQKDGGYYKAIGTCKIKNIKHIFPGYTDNEKTFVVV